jgi:hypothetical protein
MHPYRTGCDQAEKTALINRPELRIVVRSWQRTGRMKAKASKLSLGDSTMTRPDSDAVDYQCCTSLGNWPRGRTSRRVGPSINPSWLGEPRSKTLAERTRTCDCKENRKESKWDDGRIRTHVARRSHQPAAWSIWGCFFDPLLCSSPTLYSAAQLSLSISAFLCCFVLSTQEPFKGLCVDPLLKPTGDLAFH